MSSRILALATSAALAFDSAPALAKGPASTVTAGQLMEFCSDTTSGKEKAKRPDEKGKIVDVDEPKGVTRADVRGLTDEFNLGLVDALEAPTKREVREALAYALYDAIAKDHGTVKALVSLEEIKKFLDAADATLKDKVRIEAEVQPNREELLKIREGLAENDAILNLMLTINGKPICLRDLIKQYPQFEELLEYTRAQDFAKAFEAKHHLNCADAIEYARQNNGAFPAKGTELKAHTPVTMTITVDPDEVSSLSIETPWKAGLNAEAVEYDYAKAWIVSQDARARQGLLKLEEKFRDYDGTKAPITIEVGKD